MGDASSLYPSRFDRGTRESSDAMTSPCTLKSVGQVLSSVNLTAETILFRGPTARCGVSDCMPRIHKSADDHARASVGSVVSETKRTTVGLEMVRGGNTVSQEYSQDKEVPQAVQHKRDRPWIGCE